MERIAKFEKVSADRLITDLLDTFAGMAGMDKKKAGEIYEEIVMPRRATAGSAGYDICTPVDISLKPGEGIRIPTGIRARMREDYCLIIVPRSGLGSRFRFQLDNSVGVIDSDYYYSDNEGHIFVPMINDSRSGKELFLKAGAAFVQGIFCPYGITEDDQSGNRRNGGFGSTG